MRRDVVIVGGGLAAVRTAQGLRDLGFEGSIVLVSDEDRLPYDRPPLSKEYLLGRATDDDRATSGRTSSARGSSSPTVGAQPQLRLASGAMHDRAFVAVLGEPDQATAVFAMTSPREFMRTTRALRR